MRVELGQQALHAVEHRLVQRDVDDLAGAAALHVMQREQRADHAVQRSDRVAEREVRARRRSVGKARDVAHAADPFGDGGESRPLAIRPGLSVAGDAHEDELRVVARERVPAEVPLLERAGAEILDHDLRAAGEAPHDLLPLGTAQVAGHGFLVPGLHMPPERGAVPDAAPLAQGVALARRLDLDHLGAEVAQRLGAERPGDERAELKHPDTGKRTCHENYVLSTKSICA